MTRRSLRWLSRAVPVAALAAVAGPGGATAPDDAHAMLAGTPTAASDVSAASAASAAATRSHARPWRVRLALRRGRIATRAAATRIGRPYAMGASGPSAFDCSGLTSWAMRRAGIALPRTSFAQAGVGRSVSRSRIRRGDLVFFSTAGPGASHVGIAASRDTVISATSHGVMRHAISDAYWGSHYVAARRVAARR
jgi:peptidoglycan DL-endopeptidase CwlO